MALYYSMHPIRFKFDTAVSNLATGYFFNWPPPLLSGTEIKKMPKQLFYDILHRKESLVVALPFLNFDIEPRRAS